MTRAAKRRYHRPCLKPNEETTMTKLSKDEIEAHARRLAERGFDCETLFAIWNRAREMTRARECEEFLASLPEHLQKLALHPDRKLNPDYWAYIIGYARAEACIAVQDEEIFRQRHAAELGTDVPIPF